MSSGVFLFQEGERKFLRKYRQVDFAQRPEAERDIIHVFNWYRSYLDSEQWAPDHATIETKAKNLLLATDALMSAIRAFECIGEPSQRRLEFNDAISDLLRENGLERTDLKDLFETVGIPLDRLRSFTKVIQQELTKRAHTEGSQISSSAEIRAEYFRKLDKVLAHHGLSDGFGQNSLIVQLIMELDGTDSPDAATDESRRKQIARSVKQAVKPIKRG